MLDLEWDSSDGLLWIIQSGRQAHGLFLFGAHGCLLEENESDEGKFLIFEKNI